MSLLGLIDHLLNFLLPALVVGALVALLAPLLMQKVRPQRSWFKQALLNALVGAVALTGGLVFFGHDGKMATYAAMVLACASTQWLAAKGWRG